MKNHSCFFLVVFRTPLSNPRLDQIDIFFFRLSLVKRHWNTGLWQLGCPLVISWKYSARGILPSPAPTMLMLGCIQWSSHLRWTKFVVIFLGISPLVYRSWKYKINSWWFMYVWIYIYIYKHTKTTYTIYLNSLKIHVKNSLRIKEFMWTTTLNSN